MLRCDPNMESKKSIRQSRNKCLPEFIFQVGQGFLVLYEKGWVISYRIVLLLSLRTMNFFKIFLTSYFLVYTVKVSFYLSLFCWNVHVFRKLLNLKPRIFGPNENRNEKFTELNLSSHLLYEFIYGNLIFPDIEF